MADESRDHEAEALAEREKILERRFHEIFHPVSPEYHLARLRTLRAKHLDENPKLNPDTVKELLTEWMKEGSPLPGLSTDRQTAGAVLRLRNLDKRIALKENAIEPRKPAAMVEGVGSELGVIGATNDPETATVADSGNDGDPVAAERRGLLVTFKAKARGQGIRVTDDMVAKAANPGKWNERTMVTWWKRNDKRSKLPHDKKIRAVLDRGPSSIWSPNIRSKRPPK